MRILIVDDELSALRQIEAVLKVAAPDAEIEKANRPKEALAIFRDREFEVVFMDIRMPGTDGVSLAREFRELRPGVNIIMLTAYPEYALDAMDIYVSDYILKPAQIKDVEDALTNLRNPPAEERKGLYVHCFGNFEVFFNGKPVRFRRVKAKELFAYLIDRRGAGATNAEIRAVLWGDDADDSDRQRNYFSQCVHDLKAALEDIGRGDVLVQNRDSYSVAAYKIDCDYYKALRRDARALAGFHGEYMSQYDWAESSIGNLTELQEEV